MEKLPEHLKEQFQDFQTALAEYYPDFHAKLAAARPPDEDVERAFLDQAYSYIESKAGVLMQDAYRLGFEIVWSNDSRTKILAIAAFRVGKDLFFAPVMFINSRVKVPGLLWNTRTKQMGHLDPEWSRWLVSKSKFTDSGPSSLDNIQQASLLNNIIGFRQRGGFSKWSYSEKDEERGDRLTEDDIDESFSTGRDPEEIFSEIERNTIDENEEPEDQSWEDFANFSHSALARKKLIEVGKGLGRKVASAMLDNLDFAEAMYCTYGPVSEWLPGLMPKQAEADLRFIPLGQVKQASAFLSVRDKAWLLKQGMYVEDNRTDDKVSCIMSGGSVETVCSPGVWEILQPDGAVKPCVVLKVDGETDRFISDVRGDYERSCSCDSWLLMRDGKFGVATGAVAGKLKEPVGKDNLKGVVTPGNKLQVGHVYVKVTETGVVSGIFSVADKQNVGDGIVEYGIRPHGSLDLESSKIRFFGKPVSVFFHPEKNPVASDTRTFVPSDMFIKLPAKSLAAGSTGRSATPLEDSEWTGDSEEMADTTTEAIDRWIFNKGMVKKVACQYVANTFALSAGSHRLEGLNRKSATFHLMKSAHMRLWDAATLLDEAEAKGTSEVTICAPRLLVKAAASMLPVWREPSWAEGRDNITGVNETYDQGWAYPVEQNFPVFPTPRFGDKFELGETAASGQSPVPEGSGIEWSTVSPDQLATLASRGETPSIFHHGVIAALAQEQDAGVDLDITKELPAHYKFIDSLGRLIFRFHWNPGAYEKLYGSDDLSEIETQLSGAWNIVGKLVLNLQQRADSFNRKGSDDGAKTGM